ncbi:MAG: hypothetical protein QOE96_1505 [Blastocatellia bacterium]|nr:hypothetical protein [Blastocatellia bacterium]
MRPNLPTAHSPRFASRHARLLLVLAASLWHISVTALVFIIGRSGRVPGQFDQKGLGNFASDGFMYQTEVLELCGVLKNQGVIVWANWPTQLHVRLYSLPVAALNGGTRFDILTIEPLNLIYYLAILILVYKLGELVFSGRAGLMAAATVALWPSFLLHTTQLLRDPLLITAVLVLMLSVTLCLKRDYAWPKGLLLGAAGTAAIVLIRIVRLPMWGMVWAIILLGVFFLIVRLVGQKRLPAGNVIFMIIVTAVVTITPHFQSRFHNQQLARRRGVIAHEEVQQLPLEEQMATHREGFNWRVDSSGNVVPSEAGSDIDQGVHLTKFSDIVRGVPRALAVGFFAPFPNMWFRDGKQVGGSGRLLSGFETMLSYVIECLALFGLWRRRRDVAAWLLCLVMTLGALVLGLVVANIGALYRLRYPFWTLLIILGAGGADYLLRRTKAATGVSTGHAVNHESPGTFHS